MPNTFVKIATVTVGAGGASSIDFTSIPSTYTDLQILLSARTDYGTNSATLEIFFNTYGVGSYSRRTILGNGATASSTSSTGSPVIYLVNSVNGTTTTSNTFSNLTMYIPNYAGSSNKSVSFDNVTENNATTAYGNLTAGLWDQTSAISSIGLVTTGNFVQYTTATLYGIKNS